MGEPTKLFFSTSPKVRLLYPSETTRIYALLHKLSLELTETILEKTTPEQIEQWNSAEIDSFYKTSLQAISASDICLFEASHPSLTLAHFIRYSLDQDKPTIVLHKEGSMPFLLNDSGITEPLLYEYTLINLEQIVRFSIQEAIDLPDAIRFNCLISAELNRYITEAAKTEHCSKSEFFRKLVRDHQKNAK